MLDSQQQPTDVGGELRPAEGATVIDADGHDLGTVIRVLGDYVQLRMEDDGTPRWFPRAELTAAGTSATFARADALARSVPPPDRYEESQYIDPAFRTEDEERQREHMLQELAEQRRELQDGDALPEAGRTVGPPVEEELGVAGGAGRDSAPEETRGTTASHANPAAPVERAAPPSVPSSVEAWQDAREQSRSTMAPNGATNVFQRAARSTFRRIPAGQGIEDALHGKWLGHPLHPVLNDAVTAGLTMAVVFDALDPKNERGMRKAADLSVAWALAWTLPTALAGAADYQSARGRAQRLGVYHMLANTTSSVCGVLSLMSRMRGRRGAARLWGMLAFAAVNAGAYFGGELVYEEGMPANLPAAVSKALAA